MRKLLCSLFVAAFAMGMTLSAVSMTSGPAWADDEEQPKAEKKQKKPAAAKPRSVTGKIKAIDAKAGTVTIGKTKDKKPVEFVVTINSKTKYKEVAGLEELKVGDKITAKYVDKDGKMVAKSVMKKLPGKGKKKGHKKKKAEEEGKAEKSEE